MLKIRPKITCPPFMLRKVVMSNAFWHGFGAVEPAGARRPVVQRIPLPSDCCAIRKGPGDGAILV